MVNLPCSELCCWIWGYPVCWHLGLLQVNALGSFISSSDILVLKFGIGRWKFRKPHLPSGFSCYKNRLELSMRRQSGFFPLSLKYMYFYSQNLVWSSSFVLGFSGSCLPPAFAGAHSGSCGNQQGLGAAHQRWAVLVTLRIKRGSNRCPRQQSEQNRLSRGVFQSLVHLSYSCLSQWSYSACVLFFHMAEASSCCHTDILWQRMRNPHSLEKGRDENNPYLFMEV